MGAIEWSVQQDVGRCKMQDHPVAFTFRWHGMGYHFLVAVFVPISAALCLSKWLKVLHISKVAWHWMFLNLGLSAEVLNLISGHCFEGAICVLHLLGVVWPRKLSLCNWRARPSWIWDRDSMKPACPVPDTYTAPATPPTQQLQKGYCFVMCWNTSFCNHANPDSSTNMIYLFFPWRIRDWYEQHKHSNSMVYFQAPALLKPLELSSPGAPKRSNIIIFQLGSNSSKKLNMGLSSNTSIFHMHNTINVIEFKRYQWE